MNEPASFCEFPCEDPERQAAERNFPPEPPPVREPPRSIPGFPPSSDSSQDAKARRGWLEGLFSAEPEQQKPLEQPVEKTHVSHKGDDLLFPPYRINNHVGELGQQTMHPDLQHANGLWTYDVHNLYGACESHRFESRQSERETDRPLL